MILWKLQTSSAWTTIVPTASPLLTAPKTKCATIAVAAARMSDPRTFGLHPLIRTGTPSYYCDFDRVSCFGITIFLTTNTSRGDVPLARCKVGCGVGCTYMFSGHPFKTHSNKYRRLRVDCTQQSTADR